MKRLFLVSAFIVLSMWANVGCAQVSALLPGSATFAKVGQPAPDFNLPELRKGALGERLALSSLRGHPVIVNFWATWCAPCRAEFPAFQAKYEKYRDSLGLVVLAVEVQDDEGVDVAQKFVDDTKVTFKILRDVNDSVSGSYQIRGLPTTIIIDRNGIVRDMILGGPMTEDALEQKITTLLN